MPNIIFKLLGPRVMRPMFCILVIFTLTMAFLPKPPATPIDRFGDKFEHVLAFAVLTVTAMIGWPQPRRWRIVMLLSALGGLIEVVQAVPFLHRDSDWHDWVADTVAIVATALLISPLVKFAGRRRVGAAHVSHPLTDAGKPH